MAIYLVQHGKARADGADTERALTEEGRADVERIAGVARNYRVPVTAVHHSGKLRARQTAGILADILGPGVPQRPEEGMNPGDDVALFATRLDNESNIMYVGHLPFMEKLTSYLLTGTSGHTIFKFQNGGIVCLDRDFTTRRWVITWALMPTIP